jgi:hypothetical protein
MSNPVTQRILPAGIMGGQEAAMEAVQGEPIDRGKVAILAGAGAVMNRPTVLGERLLGYGAAPVRAVTGRGSAAPPPATTPPAGAPPAGPAPPPLPVGSVIGMDLGRGVEPATVARHEPGGDIVLMDHEGQEHRMTGADVARFGTDLPPGEPAEPAQRTTVTVNGKTVADTEGPVPTAEAIRGAQARGETITTPPSAPPEARPRTQADLDRETAEQRVVEARAALVGKAAPLPDPVLTAIRADLDEAAKPPEPAIPRGMETPPNATALPAVALPEPPAPAAPSAAEARPAPAPGVVDLGGMGNAITGNLYGGLFDALRQGKDTFAGVRDPVIARAKPYFDQGLVKSPEDLPALVNAG